MRFNVDIEIGGAALAHAEHGTGELARILQDVEFGVLTGRLAVAGDEARLLDLNGNTVGTARMVADWAPGDAVWVTTDEGVHLKSVVETILTVPSEGYVSVQCRYLASHQLVAPVTVDHLGHDQLGRPVMARVPS